MPPRGRKPKALTAANDHPPSLKLLRDSYQTLKEFQQTVAERARSSDPRSNEISGRTTVPIFNQLLEIFKAIIDHELDDRDATSKLIAQCHRLCYFFRHQLSCLYSLPLKNIFMATNSSAPVSSSPMVGLMSYIYYTKLEDCRARVSEDNSGPNLKKEATLMAQSLENILAAFGDGIRLFMNNSEYGPKLNQFQVLVGKVLYPFLGNVLGNRHTRKLGDHVKRSLLDAGEALSGGCAENKDYIRDSNVFGPAVLSHIISDHSDFITANIALQLAFAVAPPLKGDKGVGKNQKTNTEATRKQWFEKIFPVEKFRLSLQEECVSRLSSMSSKQFWTDMGGIQARIFEDDDSRAYALPIQSGTIEEKKIRLNNLTVPVLQSTVQFNQSSLTCMIQGDDSIKENAEVTAEVCYDAILDTQLAGLSRSGKPLPDCAELILSIDLKSDSSFEGCAPTIRYAPRNGTHRGRLVFKMKPQNAAMVLRILKKRKIKFSHYSGYLEGQETNQDDLNVTSVNTSTDLLEAEDKICRENSKISICKSPVCSLEAEAFPDLSQGLPAVSNSRERVASVQRDASIHSSRGVGSSIVSTEKNQQGQAQGTSKDHSIRDFPNIKNKSSLNKTGHAGTSDRNVSSIVSGTECDNVELIFDQPKKPGRSWAKKGIIQSPQMYPPPLYERPSETLHATTSSVPKESDPKTPLIQIPTLLNRPISPEITVEEPCDLGSERDREKDENSMLAGKSWKTLVKRNLPYSVKPPPHQPKILYERTARMRAQKSSVTEKFRLTDAESTDSIDDADEEITEIRETDTKSVDNSDEEDVIVEDMPDKEFSESYKKLMVLDMDAKPKPSVKKGKDFNRPVVSTMLESLGSTSHKKASNSMKKDKITFSMDSDEVGMDAIESCTAQDFHLEKLPSCDFDYETLGLDVRNDSKIGPLHNDHTGSKIQSRVWGNPERANGKKDSKKEPLSLHSASSSERSRKLVIHPKTIEHPNLTLQKILGQINLGEKQRVNQQKKTELTKVDGASLYESSRNAKLELEIKNMAQQKERLGTSSGQLIRHGFIVSPKHSVLRAAKKTTKPPLPSTSAHKVANDKSYPLQGDPTKTISHKADLKQRTSGNGDTSDSPSTPLSRKLLGNSKNEIESPGFKCEGDTNILNICNENLLTCEPQIDCEDDMRKTHLSGKSKEKRLRFASPRPASVQRESFGSMSAKRKAHRSDIFPSQPEEGQEELPHATKRRKLKPEVLQPSKDPLKSALKPTFASVPEKNVCHFDHLDMNPVKMFQGVPHLEKKKEITRGFQCKSPLIEKLSHLKKNSLSKSPLDHDSRPRQDVSELADWHRKSRFKPSNISEKNYATEGRSEIGKNNNSFTSKNEENLSSCMDQLTKLVLTGIRNKKVKLEGIAVNTEMGIFHLTNNLIKEFDQQNKEILQTVSYHALQRQNEYKEYYDQVVDDRKRIDQDLAWIKKYRNTPSFEDINRL